MNIGLRIGKVHRPDVVLTLTRLMQRFEERQHPDGHQPLH
jgi:hypothetical protein